MRWRRIKVPERPGLDPVAAYDALEAWLAEGGVGPAPAETADLAPVIVALGAARVAARPADTFLEGLASRLAEAGTGAGAPAPSSGGSSGGGGRGAGAPSMAGGPLGGSGVWVAVAALALAAGWARW